MSATVPWPTPTYPTRDAAIVAALLEMAPGDTLTVHRAGCKAELDCDCAPDVIVVPEAAAARAATLLPQPGFAQPGFARRVMRRGWPKSQTTEVR